MSTINVVCYKSKILSNGEHPLMIRICKDKKLKYISLGISVHPQHWDFDKNKPKHNCPNKDLILKIILDKELEFQKQILELKADNKEFTATTLIAGNSKEKIKTVIEFFEEIIKELELSNKIGNAKVYKNTFAYLEQYTNNRLDIPFSHIDIDFLKGYEKWLRQKGLMETSMSLTFRTLRSVYNKAIESKYAKENSYPFKAFKVSKFNTDTEKKAISKEAIKQIMEFDMTQKNYYMQLSRNLFVFSYLCGGINFVDMANLKMKNIVKTKLL
jgi:hypothetical protein